MTGERRAVTFRIPVELDERLIDYSKQTNRSKNAGLVTLLEQALSVKFEWLPTVQATRSGDSLPDGI